MVTFLSCDEYSSEITNHHENLLIMHRKKVEQALVHATDIDLNFFCDNTRYLQHAKSVFNKLYDNQLLRSNDSSMEEILKETPRPLCFDMPVTDFEKKFFVSLISLLSQNEFEKTIVVFNETENFVLQEIFNENLKEKLLFVIASLKMIYIQDLEQKTNAILETRSGILKQADFLCLKGRAFDKCFDKCMNETFSKMNLVKWVQFSINPPAYVAWHAASCIYDCAME